MQYIYKKTKKKKQTPSPWLYDLAAMRGLYPLAGLSPGDQRYTVVIESHF